MSLSERFLEICNKKYGSCRTSVDGKPPKPVSDEFVATIIKKMAYVLLGRITFTIMKNQGINKNAKESKAKTCKQFV